jgi:hypothetical protein
MYRGRPRSAKSRSTSIVLNSEEKRTEIPEAGDRLAVHGDLQLKAIHRCFSLAHLFVVLQVWMGELLR